MKTFITENSKQTQWLGQMLGQELKGGEIICLAGDLGAGKTTFSQGLLKGLKIKGPYTSPTFAIIKHYRKRISNNQSPISKKNPKSNIQFFNIYHVDAYRVGARDMLNLGWEEIISPPAGGPENIVIIEWADRIKKIIPRRALWIRFEWLDKDKRRIKLVK